MHNAELRFRECEYKDVCNPERSENLHHAASFLDANSLAESTFLNCALQTEYLRLLDEEVPYTLHCVDDMVMIRNWGLKDQLLAHRILSSRPDVITHSLRSTKCLACDSATCRCTSQGSSSKGHQSLFCAKHHRTTLQKVRKALPMLPLPFDVPLLEQLLVRSRISSLPRVITHTPEVSDSLPVHRSVFAVSYLDPSVFTSESQDVELVCLSEIRRAARALDVVVRPSQLIARPLPSFSYAMLHL